MTVLRQSTLRDLDPRIVVPAYDRAELTAGIAHIGVGAFHRSHQAMYVDTLLGAGLARDWAIHGLGLLAENEEIRDALAPQDHLYTLVPRHGDGTWEPRVIGSLTGFSHTHGDARTAIERMADPRIRIVSLTITEGGYSIDPVTGEFDPTTPQVAADLAGDAAPTTVFALVDAALARRRAAGIKPFTIMSCDNVQGNGHIAAGSFIGFAKLSDPDLAAWMEDNVRFPNSMVDRITPRTTDADRAELTDRFGVEDRWPVVCEPFTQWVLEDNFGDGRPQFEDAGVQVVDDVVPYELMKLRLLNASHQSLAYPGYLVGYRMVHEVTTDPLFAGFLLDYMAGEAIPTLRPVPGIDLTAYCHQLIERFSNPEVGDTVARLATNTSDMISKFLLPVVRANLASGGAITRSAFVIACWARYALGVDEQGERYEIVDALAPQIRDAAARQREVPTAFLDDNRALFGDQIVDSDRFRARYVALARSVSERGVRATLSGLDTFE
ncbi:MAG: mannitol dehydrogenase family protein [Actinomycetia bacterium]|nr:mannitol dehydrogenase family protein [Actinomycetes bacterium]